MEISKYDKLVRDKIPEIISKAGKISVTDVIPSGEMIQRLDLKLLEEAEELKESHSAEEMADVLEVLHGYAHHLGIPWAEVEHIRQKKYEERGGFEKGVRLIEVRSE